MADLQIPHLQDPGEHNLQIIQHASLDFKVRVGTSLARTSPESQTVLIQKEFRETEVLPNSFFISQHPNKDISRRTTPSSSRRSSIDYSSGYGIKGIVNGKRVGRFLRRRKEYGALLKRLNSTPEIVVEGHSKPGEVS